MKQTFNNSLVVNQSMNNQTEQIIMCEICTSIYDVESIEGLKVCQECINLAIIEEVII